jgi:hypothetical protein
MSLETHNCVVAKAAQDLLRQSYPHLSEEIIKNARESSTFSWAEGENGADTYSYDEEIECICFMASKKLDMISSDLNNFMDVLGPIVKLKQE